jgi:cyanophycinase
LGGSPQYLSQTLTGSACWRAIENAFGGGAVVAGSSAGAMVLGQYVFDPKGVKIIEGLGRLPNVCVIPHHKNFGRQWSERIRVELPSAVLIGIDEETAAIGDAANGVWTVYGPGRVTLYRNRTVEYREDGQTFFLPSTNGMEKEPLNDSIIG